MGTFGTNEADFLFETSALPEGAVKVLSFTGHEELSRSFLFVIELVSTDPALPLDKPVGEKACLELHGRSGEGAESRYSRFIHGVIERFEYVQSGSRYHIYQATLVPTLQPLVHTRRSRIFQQSNTPDIVQKVLKEGKVPGDWIKPNLRGKYEPRDYCVQHQESDFDFVSRLLEHEGVFYFFNHEKDKDVLVFTDGKHAVKSLPEFPTLQHHDQLNLYEEGLSEFRAVSVMRPGAVRLRDFRFKQPGVDMESHKEGDSRFAHLEMYHFPGRYVDPGMGKQLAEVRLQEQQFDQRRYISRSNCMALRPGYKFKLDGHRRPDLNSEDKSAHDKEGYLIVSVQHQGAQPQALGEDQGAARPNHYESRLECIPAGVTYRPPRLTARPKVFGVQTALVVGPAGEDIHCDDHGRVKVQFHWDLEGKRNDSSSCWIRVSQPWGGAGQGGMFIPRIGQEVIIQFLEGDPDRPLIVGRVYNGENPVPHGLPAAKNISTIRSSSTPGGGGFNEIKFDDSAAKELFFTHAQKDKNDIVGHDHDHHVKNHQTEKVDKNRKATVGLNETLKVGVDQSLQVGGNQTNLICKDRMTTVVMNDMETVGLNKMLNVGVAYAIQVGVAMSTTVGVAQTTQVGSVKNTTVGGAMTTTVGGAMTTTVGGAMTTTIGAVSKESIGQSLLKNVGKIASETVGLLKKISAGKKIQLHSGGAKIELRSSGSKVLVQAGSSKIEMKPGKIKLDSGGGATIELDGSKITLNAAEIEINGTAKVEVKGAMIDAVASGIHTVKGSMVKINC